MTARIEELIRVATGLVEQIAEQAEADTAAFREAYQIGFESGVIVGRQQLSNELLEVDRRRAAYINGLSSLPSYAELERRRWDGRRKDFGKPRPGDYMGLPPEVDAMFFCPACQQARPYCTCQATRDGQ